MLYRPATLDDARLLFDWRNDEITRAMSRADSPIEWNAHLSWLGDRLKRPTPHLYIAERDGIPVGTFRLDGKEISYTVAPEWRGNGIGLSMIVQAQQSFGYLGRLRAEIFSRNLASIKVAERAGLDIVVLD